VVIAPAAKRLVNRAIGKNTTEITAVGDIVKFRKPDARTRAEGKTLCKNGFHRWRTDKGQRFDVKQGKLVTVQRCERCGLERTKLT
jgi:hypothetical protein